MVHTVHMGLQAKTEGLAHTLHRKEEAGLLLVGTVAAGLLGTAAFARVEQPWWKPTIQYY